MSDNGTTDLKPLDKLRFHLSFGHTRVYSE